MHRKYIGPYISQTKNSGACDCLNKKAHTEQWEGGILLCDVQAHMWPNLALWFLSASAGPRKRLNTKHQCVRPQSDMDAVSLGYCHCSFGKREDQNTEHRALYEAP